MQNQSSSRPIGLLTFQPLRFLSCNVPPTVITRTLAPLPRERQLTLNLTVSPRMNTLQVKGYLGRIILTTKIVKSKGRGASL